MLLEVLHLCLINLVRQLDQKCNTQVHIPIYDLERPINILPTWYTMLTEDHFIESNIEIVFHDRVWVYIASVTVTHSR